MHSSTRQIISVLRKHGTAILALLGVSGLGEILKEYLRAKLMDWAVSHLGGFGEWLFANPFSLLTLGTLAAAVFILIALVSDTRQVDSPILRDKNTYYSAVGVSRRWRYGVLLLVLVIVVLIGIGAYKYWVRQDIILDVYRVMIGEPRGVSPATAVLLDLTLTNIGPPSTTSDWSLTVKFNDGEVGTGKPLENDFTDNIAVSPSNPEIAATRQVKREELLSVSTATVPIPTGGKKDGPVSFLVPGFYRETVNEPGTKLRVSFKDARGNKYEREFPVPAKAEFIVLPKEHPPLTQQ